MKKLAAIIVLSLPVSVYAGEKIIKEFDGSVATASAMSKVIRKEAAEGATVVTFPGGRWQWHDLTQLNLPPKVKPAKKVYPVVFDQLEDSIKEWVLRNNIAAVQIRINPKVPADVFFRVEKCLSLLGVPYAVTSMKALMKDALWLMETDGKVISVEPGRGAVSVPSREARDPTSYMTEDEH